MTDAGDRQVYTARGPVDGEDWTSVADALNRRMADRRIGQQELAHLSGVSVSTLRQLQHGAGRRVQNKTLAAISRALDWPDGHLSGVLLANRPPVIATPPQAADAIPIALQRIESCLSDISQRLARLERTLGSRRPPA